MKNPQEVERFDMVWMFNVDPYMAKCPDGDFVRIEDYEKLYNQVKAEVSKLEKAAEFCEED
jgi:hypothetical protein